MSRGTLVSPVPPVDRVGLAVSASPGASVMAAILRLPDRRRLRGRAQTLYTRSYYRYLPMAPVLPSLDAARGHWLAICALIDRGGWTHDEWTGLHRLEKRWRARAHGEDRRWLTVGSQPGRLDRQLEATFKPPEHPAWKGGE